MSSSVAQHHLPSCRGRRSPGLGRRRPCGCGCRLRRRSQRLSKRSRGCVRPKRVTMHSPRSKYVMPDCSFVCNTSAGMRTQTASDGPGLRRAPVRCPRGSRHGRIGSVPVAQRVPQARRRERQQSKPGAAWCRSKDRAVRVAHKRNAFTRARSRRLFYDWTLISSGPISGSPLRACPRPHSFRRIGNCEGLETARSCSLLRSG